MWGVDRWCFHSCLFSPGGPYPIMRQDRQERAPRPNPTSGQKDQVERDPLPTTPTPTKDWSACLRMLMGGCLVTARIRRMGEGNVFTGMCPFTGGPQSQILSEVTSPFLGGGGTPILGSFPGHWSQVLSGEEYPSPGWRVPHPWLLVPQSWQGVPQYGVPTQPGEDGVLPGKVRMWYSPSRTGVPTPPGQNSWVGTCYMAGGMPLAVMQDFLDLPMKLVNCWRLKVV